MPVGPPPTTSTSTSAAIGVRRGDSTTVRALRSTSIGCAAMRVGAFGSIAVPGALSWGGAGFVSLSAAAAKPACPTNPAVATPPAIFKSFRRSSALIGFSAKFVHSTA